jgi:hypothetical protein
MSPLNNSWVRVKGFFKRVVRAKPTEDPKKKESIVRDLSPVRDALGGASKAGVDDKPSKNPLREIDFMKDAP